MIKSLLCTIFFAAATVFLSKSISAQCNLVITGIQVSSDISCSSSCNGELTVSFSGAVGIASFQWLDTNNIDLGINDAIATGLCAGTYTVFITDGNNCTRDTVMTITEPSALSISVTRINSTCTGATGELTITGSDGCSGYQYAISGGLLQTSDVFSNLAVGFYTVTVQDSCGCSLNFTEYVSSTNGPSIINLNFINPLCNGGNNGSITIFAVGSLPVIYSIDGGTTFTANNVYTNLPSGGYSIVVEDGGGCQSLGYLTIIEPSSVLVLPVSINETCALNNGSIDLQSQGGTGTYQYSINNGTVFQSGSLFSGLAGGTYDYIVEDANACQNIGQVVLTTGAGPTITSSMLLNPVCTNNCNGVISISALGNAPITFSANGGTLQSTGNFLGLCDTVYDIVISDVDGCTTSQTITLTAPLPPNAGFTLDDSIGLAPLTVNFTNTSVGASSYFWSFGDTSSTSSAVDTSFTYTSIGLYSVMMIATELSCTDTSYKQITVSGIPNVSMPNVFTPNNDGLNDVFRPIVVGASEITGQIYNRYGEKIYEWWGINGYWDGYTRPSGELVPTGTYFYIVTGTDIAGGTYELTGTVQLMR